MTHYDFPKRFDEFPVPKRKFFNFRQFFKPFPEPSQPSGEMAEYLGEIYSWQRVYDAGERFEESDIAKIKQYVRTYAVPALIGQTFSIQHETELEESLNRLVQQQLSNIVWEPFHIHTGAFRKYLIVHFQIPAPPDRLTGQAMGLEIFVEPSKINGFSSDSEQFGQLRRNYMFASVAADWPEVSGDFEMTIVQATYSNISYPGIGIQFYS